MMEGRPYQGEETMNETSLSRRMQAFAILNLFGYGSLWVVGENIWKAKLPEYYVQREDRMEHPAICVQNDSADSGIHAVVPMWYGTTLHGDREKDKRLVREGKRYAVKNFYDDTNDKCHITMFGNFKPVPIEKDCYDLSSAATKNEERRKNKIWRNTKRCLDVHELDGLRRFSRRFLAIG